MNGNKYLLDHTGTARLHFRKFQTKDFQDWLPFFSDPASTAFWEGTPKFPEAACRDQFHRIFERYEKGLGGMNALIDREHNGLVGMCGLLIQVVDGVREMEIGYSLLPEYRGMGYATEAGIHCRDQAFKNHWSESLISIIHRANVPSMRVASRLGMQNHKATHYKRNPVYIFRVDKVSGSET